MSKTAPQLTQLIHAVMEKFMDLLNGRIRPLYFKYLAAAFGSAMITSIYSIVDMAMVGQYQGPDGTAALSVVAPIWNIIYSLGLLMGIGGSVIFSTIRGESGSDEKTKADRTRTDKNGKNAANEFFTASAVGSVFLSAAVWIMIVLFEKPLLTLFGANENLLPLALTYVKPIKFVIPFFLFNQMLAAFLRNDGNPGLATAGVLAGGIFNIFGDYIFVFTFDMGIFGAGLATAVGSVLSFAVLVSHFFTKKNSLSLKRPSKILSKLKQISVTGFSTFFIDVAMGILTILFNRQIMKYLGTSALSVYGPIVNVSTLVQSCAYSVGQASQPIISVNFGAKKWKGIREVLKYALYTVAFFGVLWTAVSELFPNLYVRIFMKPTEEILEIAPKIIRRYSISFLLLPLNIFSTYYFQALMKPKAAFIVSVSRGFFISGILIMSLPLVFTPDAIWFSMPVTELLVAFYAVFMISRYTKNLSN